MKFPGLNVRCLSLCAALMILGMVTMTAPTHAEDAKEKDSTAKLRHVVVFKFKDSATPQDIEKVEKAFAELPKKISQIKEYEWGTNNSPEMLDKGFTHCFLVTFASEADREAYLPHPEHKKFVGLIGPYLEEAFVIDYWTK